MAAHIVGTNLFELAKFAKLVRPATKPDGTCSQVRRVTLAYDGTDQLTMCAGDGQMFVMAQLPITRSGDNFAVSVEHDRFERLAATVGEFDSGIALVPVNGVLGLEADRLWLPLHHCDSYPASPAPLADGHMTVVDRAELAAAIQLVIAGGATGPPEDDKYDRSNMVCTFRADGTFYGVRKSVVLVARGPQLGFDVSLRRQHAGQLFRWLRLLPKSAELYGEKSEGEESEDDGIEIARTLADDRVMFRFVHKRGPQILLLPERTTPFACHFVDNLPRPFDLQLRVNRQKLAQTLAVFRGFGRKLLLRYSWQNEANQLQVSMANVDPPPRDEIDVELLGDRAETVEFTAAASAVELALGAIGGEHVVLALRKGQSAVTSSADATLPVGDRSRRAYFVAQRTQGG